MCHVGLILPEGLFLDTMSKGTVWASRVLHSSNNKSSYYWPRVSIASVGKQAETGYILGLVQNQKLMQKTLELVEALMS